MVGHAPECGGDGEGGRGEEFAKDESDELVLGVGDGDEFAALQVVGDLFVEGLFVVGWIEIAGDAAAFGEADVFEDLFAEGAGAERVEALLEAIEAGGVEGGVGEPVFEGALVAEDLRVDDGDEAV